MVTGWAPIRRDRLATVGTRRADRGPENCPQVRPPLACRSRKSETTLSGSHCPRPFLAGCGGLGGAAAFDPRRLSTRAESPPSCSESNFRPPCSADTCRWRPICSASRCCSARSSWIVCWRLATASLAVLSAISAAADSSALGGTTATGEDSYPIRLLPQSTAPTATARRRSRIQGSMRRSRLGSLLT
jgi:hypothetical protein